MNRKMEGSNVEPPADFIIIARPNCSLSPASRLVFLCGLVCVTFGIALLFAWAGAWLILPFAGLEVGVLWWAFHHIAQHAQDYEKITIQGDRVTVESQNAQQFSRQEFNRHWAQLSVHRPARGTCRLALRSHGRERELGRHLSSAQRVALANQLRMQLRHGI